MALCTQFFISPLLSVMVIFYALGRNMATAYPWGSSVHPDNRCNITQHPDVSDLNGTSYVNHVRAAHLPSGRTYRYVNYRPSSAENPTILFLHGFPSSSYDWRHQFDYFSSRGYGVITPDLLGYGGTDKPADVKVYTLETQASDIIDLLDCAGVGTLFSVGHDLGSPLLSRLATYYPNRCAKYAFLDIGYSAPPLHLNAAGIAALDAQTLATEAYEPSGYWAWFNENGTGKIIDQHDREIHNNIFAAKRGGYDPTLNHYRALYRNYNLADEIAIPSSAKNLTKPVLLLTASKDPIGTPARAGLSTRPFVPDIRVRQIESGHFMMLEKSDEVNEALREFFE